MSDSHGDGGQGHEAIQKSSPLRLLMLAVVMVGFAVLTWGVALFLRGKTGIDSTGTNYTLIFIPAWLTLTIATVAVSFWFTKRMLTAEKYRDSENAPPQAHSH